MALRNLFTKEGRQRFLVSEADDDQAAAAVMPVDHAAVGMDGLCQMVTGVVMGPGTPAEKAKKIQRILEAHEGGNGDGNGGGASSGLEPAEPPSYHVQEQEHAAAARVRRRFLTGQSDRCPYVGTLPRRRTPAATPPRPAAAADGPIGQLSRVLGSLAGVVGALTRQRGGGTATAAGGNLGGIVEQQQTAAKKKAAETSEQKDTPLEAFRRRQREELQRTAGKDAKPSPWVEMQWRAEEERARAAGVI